MVRESIVSAMLSGMPGRRLTAPVGLGEGVADCAGAGAGGEDCGMLTPSNFSASCTENEEKQQIGRAHV